MKARILLVHNYPTQFVQVDLALLRERYDVEEWYQRTRRVDPPALARAVRRNQLVFAWFASWHSFVPLLFACILQRPSVLLIGGYDTANLPEIGYGSQRGGLRRQIARQTMQLATRLVTNSHYARGEAVHNAGIDACRITVVHHGFRADDWGAPLRKETLVMTAGNVDRDNLQRKGLESFTRAAALLPDVPFVLVGAWRDRAIDSLRRIAAPNVRFTGWVETGVLDAYYARARVYVQASRHEAFGMALAEAMLHECVPVATRLAALPEVVGEAGIYAERPEPEPLAAAVRRALAAGPEWGRSARQRITEEFPIERRRNGLYAVIEQALAGHG